jgi:hypothetical protein
MKTKQDLINTVLKQIEVDVDCRDYTAIEELIQHLSMDTLIEYLPVNDWNKFKHLRNAPTT